MAEDMQIPPTPRSMSPVQEEEESDIELNYDAPTTTAPEDAFFKNFQASRLTENIHEIGVALNSRRKAAPDTIIGAATAWIDRDDSGTYDPDAERVRSTARRNKRVRVVGSCNKDDAPKFRKKNRPPETLVLKFTNEKSLDYLRSITPDSEVPGSSSANELSDSEGSEGDSGSGSRRTRRKPKQPKRLGVVEEREDGLKLEDLTQGHPQRRGCKACFLQCNDDCSLIEHAFEYPCVECDDADVECELIVPPKLKKSCQACKRKRVTCSYREDGGKGVDACKACEYDDEVCCAAPMKESAYSKRFDDADDIPAPPPISKAATRMFVACCECREAGLRCSLKRGQDGPCKTCHENNEDCTFVFEGKNGALPPIKVLKPSKTSTATSKAVSKQKRRRKRSPSPPSPTVETAAHSLSTPGTAWKVLGVDAEKEFKRSRKGIKEGKLKHHATSIPPTLTAQTLGLQHKIIRTCFAHPIKFNYVPDPANAHPCSWCSAPFFGLWGFGEVEVEVIPWSGALGNEEIVGGWASDKGHESTKMCVECTFTRVRIITCQGHRVRRIEGLDKRSFQPKMLEHSFGALAIGDKKGGKLAMETKWCNICVAVAEYKCCTKQHYSDSAEQLSNTEELKGCGLYLCATCNDTFERIEKSKGNNPTVVVLDALVAIRKNELWKAESDKVRADSEFLTTRGELMVRMAQGMGVGVQEDAGAAAETDQGMEFGGAMDTMMKGVCEKKSGKGKGKQKEKMVFGGELTPTPTSTPQKLKGEVKGKGKVVDCGNSFGADSSWEAGTDARAAKSWDDMWR